MFLNIENKMIKYLNDTNIKKYINRTAFLRIDLNAKKGQEKNFFRLQKVIPTIKKLIENQSRIIIAAHRGRYNENPPSNKIFQKIIQEKINKKVAFIKETNPELIKEKIEKKKTSIILLENLRMNKNEQSNDIKYAQKLSKLAQFYINDAFPVCHRKNASVTKITRFLPSFGGLELQKEIEKLTNFKENPQKPFTLIIGGKKTKSKLATIKNLWDKIDNLLLGGGPANTFLFERGIDIKNSIYDKNSVKKIKPFSIADKTFVPVDYKTSDGKILDIGKETSKIYADMIKKSKTIIWNGPMGLFEKEKFAEGTKKIWNAIVKNQKANTVIGGGETVSSKKLINKNIPKNVFLSTGGGAMLTFLANKKMPGINALKNE